MDLSVQPISNNQIGVVGDGIEYLNAHLSCKFKINFVCYQIWPRKARPVYLTSNKCLLF